MPLNPGNTPVTFTPPGRFVVDKYHTVPASSGETGFTQAGCMFQPISVKDKVENTAYAEATDKLFTPYNANIQSVFSSSAAGAEWYVNDGTFDYRVLGNESVADTYGRFVQGVFVVKNEAG